MAQLVENPPANPKWTITLKGIDATGSAGLFAAIKGATLTNFNVIVDGDISVSNSSNNDSAAGGPGKPHSDEHWF